MGKELDEGFIGEDMVCPDHTKVVIINDLRKKKIGGNYEGKLGMVQYEVIRIRNTDGSIQSEDRHPVIYLLDKNNRPMYDKFIIGGLECNFSATSPSIDPQSKEFLEGGKEVAKEIAEQGEEWWDKYENDKMKAMEKLARKEMEYAMEEAMREKNRLKKAREKKKEGSS